MAASESDPARNHTGLPPYGALTFENSDQMSNEAALGAASGTVAAPLVAISPLSFATDCLTSAPGRIPGRSVGNLTLNPPTNLNSYT